MEDTKKMIQQVCQPKFKITDGKLNTIRFDFWKKRKSTIFDEHFTFQEQIKEAMDSKVVPTDKNSKVSRKYAVYFYTRIQITNAGD